MDRPSRSLRFFGLLIWHDRGLAFVYSTVLAAWTYLFMHALIQFGQLLLVEIAVPVLVFAAVFGQLFFLDKPTDELESLPKPYRSLLMAFVYSTALAAGTYLFMHALIQFGQLLLVEIAVPVLVFAAVFGQLFFLDKPTDELESLPKPYRSLLKGEQQRPKDQNS